MEKIEGNRIIAEFMGYKRHEGHSGNFARFKHWNIQPFGWFDDEDLKYHSSWDWLMPVVEKIESLGFLVRMDNKCCEILNMGICYAKQGDKFLESFEDIYIESDSRKTATYDAVIQFILWYNNNKQ